MNVRAAFPSSVLRKEGVGEREVEEALGGCGSTRSRSGADEQAESLCTSGG